MNKTNDHEKGANAKITKADAIGGSDRDKEVLKSDDVTIITVFRKLNMLTEMVLS